MRALHAFHRSVRAVAAGARRRQAEGDLITFLSRVELRVAKHRGRVRVDEHARAAFLDTPQTGRAWAVYVARPSGGLTSS
jgi:hypothetical protein